MSTSSLTNKVIWLTGASSGIGEALVRELSQSGAKLAITARNREKLDALARAGVAEGFEVRAYSGDVLDVESMRRIAASIQSDLGEIDLLIANAGSHVFTRPLQFDSAEYQSLMDLNFSGVLHCIEAVLPSMLKRRRGRICGVASLAGFRALPRAAAYGASKAALMHFLESIRFHLEREGVGVTVVNPGFVRTPLTDKNDFPMPFLMEAEDAARRIVRGLERNRREISFPLPFVLILRAARVLPNWIYSWIVTRLWKRLGCR